MKGVVATSDLNPIQEYAGITLAIFSFFYPQALLQCQTDRPPPIFSFDFHVLRNHGKELYQYPRQGTHP